MVSCGPIQVAIEYSMAAGGLLIAARCCAFMVKVVVGATTVSTLWNFIASHVYIGEVAELKAVLALRVLVVRVHTFCFAGPVVDASPGLFGWNAAWDCKG